MKKKFGKSHEPYGEKTRHLPAWAEAEDARYASRFRTDDLELSCVYVVRDPASKKHTLVAYRVVNGWAAVRVTRSRIKEMV